MSKRERAKKVNLIGLAVKVELGFLKFITSESIWRSSVGSLWISRDITVIVIDKFLFIL